MPISDFLHMESDVITGMPVEIPFDYRITTHIPQGTDLGNTLVCPVITVQTWFRIKPLILQIDQKDYNELLATSNTPDTEIVRLISKYDSVIMQILFCCLHNAPGELPEWHKQVIIDNCSWFDIHILLNACLFRIGQQSFRKSITTLRSVSPWSELEIIAAQKNLESWKTAREVQ